MDRVPRSCGCCEQRMLKKRKKKRGGGGCLVIVDDYRELSNIIIILGIYIELQLRAFKVVQETLNK